MKVLCVVPSYWPAFEHGGPIFSVHNWNKALVNQGAKVDVFTTNHLIEDQIKPIEKTVKDRVNIKYFGYLKTIERFNLGSWQFSYELTKELQKNIQRYDIVYMPAVWNYPSAITSYYARQNNVPYVIAPKGVLYPHTFKKEGLKKKIYYQLISKRDLINASAIMYSNEHEKSEVENFLGIQTKSILVPNILDFNEIESYKIKQKTLKERYPEIKNKKVILFLSRLCRKKGLDILAESYGKLLAEKENIHLLIVGPDSEGIIDKVKNWFAQANALDSVTFTGMLKGKKKYEAYFGSDIFVLPSYSENFGMVVAEAMASKLPVVITNQVGIHNVVKEMGAGRVTEPRADQIKDSLHWMLEHKDQSKQMGRCGRKLVKEKFSPEKVGSTIFGAFNSIIN